jgi:hypothetical protein
MWMKVATCEVNYHEFDNFICSILSSKLNTLNKLGAPLLTDYRKELQYHTFSQEDLLNYSVNIYDEGNLVR